MDRSIAAMFVRPKIEKVTVIVELAGEHSAHILEYIEPDEVTVQNSFGDPEPIYLRPRPPMSNDAVPRADLRISRYKELIRRQGQRGIDF